MAGVTPQRPLEGYELKRVISKEGLLENKFGLDYDDIAKAGYYQMGDKWVKNGNLATYAQDLVDKRNVLSIGANYNANGNVISKPNQIVTSQQQLLPSASNSVGYGVSTVDDIIEDKVLNEVVVKSSGLALAQSVLSGVLTGISAIGLTLTGSLAVFKAVPESVRWLARIERFLGIDVPEDADIDEMVEYFKENSFLNIYQDYQTFLSESSLKLINKLLHGYNPDTNEYEDDYNAILNNGADVISDDVLSNPGYVNEKFEGRALEGVTKIANNQWLYPNSCPVLNIETITEHYGSHNIGVYPSDDTYNRYSTSPIDYVGNKTAFLIYRDQTNRITIEQYKLSETGTSTQINLSGYRYYQTQNLGAVNNTYWSTAIGNIDITNLYLWSYTTIPVFIASNASERTLRLEQLFNYLRYDNTEGIANYKEPSQRKNKVPGIIGVSPRSLLPSSADSDLSEIYGDNYIEKVNKYSVDENNNIVVEKTKWYPAKPVPSEYEEFTPQEETITKPMPEINPDPNPETNPVINGSADIITDPDYYPDVDINDNPILNPPSSDVVDEGDTEIFIPPISQYGEGLVAIYNPTKDQLREFSQWLWGSNFDIDSLKKLFQNPMEAIIGLHKVFCTPTRGENKNIQVGYIDSGVNSRTVSNPITVIDMGYASIPRVNNDVSDFSPYSSCRLYLPFIGFVNIDIDEVVGGVINLKYYINVLTGACLCAVSVNRNNMNSVLYQFPGNCAVQLPITSGNMTSVLTSIAGVVAGTIATIASGGAALPTIGTALMSSGIKAKTEMLGNLSGNIGELAGKQPYIILTRRKEYLPFEYNKFYGYPSNNYIKLGDCSGYTKVKEIHLENMGLCTEEEKILIQNSLMSGVIF